jgi:hypothetical protein
MRTTLTLEDDNADRLRDLSERTRRPFKQVVNEVIRRGLDTMSVEEPQAPFKVKPHPMGLKAGIDPARLSHYEGELDVEAFGRLYPQKEKAEP